MNNAGSMLRSFSKSIWLFPALLIIPVLILTSMKISGSSIGVYNNYFFDNKVDDNLLVNNPQHIRSDEWGVEVQMALAQSKINYSRNNPNIGEGQDMSVVTSAPYKEWTTVFKPLNVAFFILPFDIAFALKWWLMGYLLIVSLYFFTLQLLPNKKLLASILSFGFFFSPFIQWWYAYGTLATLYYSLFCTVFFMKILSSSSKYWQVFWSALFTYTLICFAFVLYPPFQVPALIAVAFFSIGYTLEKIHETSFRKVLLNFRYVFASLFIVILTIGLFYWTRSAVINTIQNTAYPGKRVVLSGGFDKSHIFSSHFANQQQYPGYSKFYSVTNGSSNQSETSNFILVLPYLLIPAFYVLYLVRKHKKIIDWPLLCSLVGSTIIFGWMFLPNIDIFGKIIFLDKIPQSRLLIGLGLLNYFIILLIIKLVSKYKVKVSTKLSLIYCVLVLAFLVLIAIYTVKYLPHFISVRKSIALSLPLPCIIFLLLKNRPLLAVMGLSAFTIYGSYLVNPLYRGTSIVSETPVSYAIQEISKADSTARWATDESMLENFASMNGAKTISGVYAYPQLQLWNTTNSEEDTYNRYAHTNFVFDRDAQTKTPTTLKLVGGDNFGVYTEPCGDFVQQKDVGYILTGVKFDSKESCLSLQKTINYSRIILYIYKINL